MPKHTAYSRRCQEIMRIGADEKAIALQEVLRDGSSSEAILGFEWTHPGELLVINSYGPELYQVCMTSTV